METFSGWELSVANCPRAVVQGKLSSKPNQHQVLWQSQTLYSSFRVVNVGSDGVLKPAVQYCTNVVLLYVWWDHIVYKWQIINTWCLLCSINDSVLDHLQVDHVIYIQYVEFISRFVLITCCTSGALLLLHCNSWSCMGTLCGLWVQQSFSFFIYRVVHATRVFRYFNVTHILWFKSKGFKILLDWRPGCVYCILRHVWGVLIS